METHPQQAPLGIINMLISRCALMDSISHSLEVLYEMPYTTDFPPGLPTDLEQLLRDLHASTERLMDEVMKVRPDHTAEVEVGALRHWGSKVESAEHETM